LINCAKSINVPCLAMALLTDQRRAAGDLCFSCNDRIRFTRRWRKNRERFVAESKNAQITAAETESGAHRRNARLASQQLVYRLSRPPRVSCSQNAVRRRWKARATRVRNFPGRRHDEPDTTTVTRTARNGHLGNQNLARRRRQYQRDCVARAVNLASAAALVSESIGHKRSGNR